MSRRINHVSLRDLFTSNPGELVCSSNNSFMNDSGMFESSQLSQMSQSRSDWSDGSQLSQVKSPGKFCSRYLSKGPVFSSNAMPKGPMCLPKPTAVATAGSQSQSSTLSQPQIELYKAKAGELDRRDLLTGVIASIKELSLDVKAAVSTLKETIQLGISTTETQLNNVSNKIEMKLDKNKEDVGTLLSTHNETVATKLNYFQQHVVTDSGLKAMEAAIAKQVSDFEQHLISEIQQSCLKQSELVRSTTSELISIQKREIGILSTTTERQIIDMITQTKSVICHLEEELMDGLRNSLKVNRSSEVAGWNLDNDLRRDVQHLLTASQEKQQRQIESVLQNQMNEFQQHRRDLAVENQRQFLDVLSQLRDYPNMESGVKETQKLERIVKNILDEKVERYVQSVGETFGNCGNAQSDRNTRNLRQGWYANVGAENECHVQPMLMDNSRQPLQSAGRNCERNVTFSKPSTTDTQSAMIVNRSAKDATLRIGATPRRRICFMSSNGENSGVTDGDVNSGLNSALTASNKPRGDADTPKECGVFGSSSGCTGVNVYAMSRSESAPNRCEMSNAVTDSRNITSDLKRNAVTTVRPQTEPGMVDQTSTSRMHRKDLYSELTSLNACPTPSLPNCYQPAARTTSFGGPPLAPSLFGGCSGSLNGCVQQAVTSTPNPCTASAAVMNLSSYGNASLLQGQLQPLSRCLIGPSPVATVFPQVQVPTAFTDSAVMSTGLVQGLDNAAVTPAADVLANEGCNKNSIVTRRRKRRKSAYYKRPKVTKNQRKTVTEDFVMNNNSASLQVKRDVGEVEKTHAIGFRPNAKCAESHVDYYSDVPESKNKLVNKSSKSGVPESTKKLINKSSTSAHALNSSKNASNPVHGGTQKENIKTPLIARASNSVANKSSTSAHALNSSKNSSNPVHGGTQKDNIKTPLIARAANSVADLSIFDFCGDDEYLALPHSAKFGRDSILRSCKAITSVKCSDDQSLMKSHMEKTIKSQRKCAVNNTLKRASEEYHRNLLKNVKRSTYKSYWSPEIAVSPVMSCTNHHVPCAGDLSICQINLEVVVDDSSS